MESPCLQGLRLKTGLTSPLLDTLLSQFRWGRGAFRMNNFFVFFSGPCAPQQEGIIFTSRSSHRRPQSQSWRSWRTPPWPSVLWLSLWCPKVPGKVQVQLHGLDTGRTGEAHQAACICSGPIHRSSRPTFHWWMLQARQEGLRAPPGMLLGGPGPPVKRPTFDQLDKRASWSADRGMVAPGPHPPSQFLASSTRPHPNNMVNHPNNLAHHPSTLPNKKPVPLPRWAHNQAQSHSFQQICLTHSSH